MQSRQGSLKFPSDLISLGLMARSAPGPQTCFFSIDDEERNKANNDNKGNLNVIVPGDVGERNKANMCGF